MTSDVVASALAGLGPMMMQGQRKPVDKYAARRQFGDALLMQGAQATPLRGGVAEGLARAGQAVLGGYLASNADTEQKAEDEANSQALIEAIAKSQTRGPDGQMSFDPSPVAQALAKTNPGMAAYLQLIGQLGQRQQAQSADRARILLGGDAPPASAPPQGGGGYFERVSATESPNGATNPQSGAMGFYQLMPDTVVGLAQQTQWGQAVPPAQLFEMVKADPGKQRELMALYTRQSEATLQQAGLPINDVSRFALHAFGPAGGVSLLRAPDNMPVAEWVRSVNWGRATPDQVIAQNNLGKYQTVGQLRQDFIARRIGGGQPPAQAQPPGPPMPPAPTMGAAPPAQPAPQVAAAPVEGGGVDDSGQDRGMSPGFGPTVPLAPQMRVDDGSRDMDIARRLLALNDPQSQALGMRYLQAAQEKQAKAQQFQVDLAGKEPPMLSRTADGRGVAVVEGAEDAKRRLAAAEAQGGAQGRGVLQPGVDPNTGAPGQVNPVTGDFKPAAAPFNEAQGRSATFADRMSASERNLREVEGQGTSALGAFLERLGTPGNYLQSPEYQRYEQARRDFINAQLRRESGAVISPDEFANAEKQYFPRPGDSPAVIEQKRRNRQIAIDGMMRDAGPAYKPRQDAPKGSDTLQQARDAIARGAPRDKVIERLRSLGVDPGGL